MSWKICVAFGLLVIVLSAVIFPIFPAEGAGYAPGYGAPVYAFEMAQSVEDLIAVFGTLDDPARPARIAAMDAGNYWDFPFMAAYGAFLATFFLAVRTQTGQKMWSVFVAIAVLSALADVVENNILLGLTANLEAAQNLHLLAYPVWTKFLSLMVVGAAAGFYMFKSQTGLLWKVLGTLTSIGALSVLAAFYAADVYGAIAGAGLGVCWLVMLVFAFSQARKASQ
ncbi:hypothetical protein [Kordiimonas aquimaris]|uniref:hypothetical protein n=1 Tax=Kordiimonas aquimaris TaxID=707591 RepID=UPI0021D335F7|nr:hypothetical protein [Kordiimonas aquimaris]